MSRSRNGRAQFTNLVARQAAETKVATYRTAYHVDGACALPFLLTQNKSSDSGGLDRRNDDRRGAELLSQKPADDPATLLTGINGQAPDVVHVDLEPSQLFPYLIIGDVAAGDGPGCSQYIQQLGERGSNLVDKAPYRIGAIATWQMIGNKPGDRGLIDCTQGEPLVG